MRKFTIVALSGLAALAGAGVAQAASLQSLLFPGSTIQLSDNSAEYLLNAPVTGATDWTMSNVNDHTLDLGDRLRGILSFDTVENLDDGLAPMNSLHAGGNPEFTALFDVVVTEKTRTNPITDPVALYTYKFGAYSGLASEFGTPTGTMGVFFEDPAVNFSRLDNVSDGIDGGDRATEIAHLEGLATDGTYRMALGFNGDLDEIWTSENSPDDVWFFRTISSSTRAGQFTMNLSILEETFGLNFVEVFASVTGLPGGDDLIGLGGNGDMKGIRQTSTTLLDTPFDAWDNTDARLKTVVPEPASLLLLGTGLLGLGAVARRKKKA